MSAVPQSAQPATRPPRILGQRRGATPGPLVLVAAGIHGNEPSGLAAASRVLDELERHRLELAGDLVVLAGNTRALAAGQRFVDHDLNRCWTPERVETLLADGPGPDSEEQEQLELLAVLDRELAAARGPVYFVDLHTSSADGCPFWTCGDTLRNRSFALSFPGPVILGLEEQLDGSLLEYLSERGCRTIGAEAGQHDAPSSVDHHEAALWIALVVSGCLERSAVPDYEAHRALIEEATRGLPHALAVAHRHAIRPEDAFVMEPGFVNFQPVSAGQLLAKDRQGLVHAEEAGRILLPLYQGLGQDGYFLGRELGRVWLLFSALGRRLGLGTLLSILPGVRSDRTRPHSLRLSSRARSLVPRALLFFFGYRRLREDGGALLATRRRDAAC